MTTELERGPWRFDRYVNGVLMAEGVCVARAANFAEAIAIASVCASEKGTVLVLRPTAAPIGDEAGSEVRREIKRMLEAARNWRRPELAQVEGPNDLKIYGGAIADDIDRWAALLAAASSEARKG